MAIRLRTVSGIRVALCAVESDPQPGDVYLDDGDHYALVAKFCQDHGTGTEYPEHWAAMVTQKVRDARDEHARWLANQCPEGEQVVALSPSEAQVLTC